MWISLFNLAIDHQYSMSDSQILVPKNQYKDLSSYSNTANNHPQINSTVGILTSQTGRLSSLPPPLPPRQCRSIGKGIKSMQNSSSNIPVTTSNPQSPANGRNQTFFCNLPDNLMIHSTLPPPPPLPPKPKSQQVRSSTQMSSDHSPSHLNCPNNSDHLCAHESQLSHSCSTFTLTQEICAPPLPPRKPFSSSTQVSNTNTTTNTNTDNIHTFTNADCSN